MKRSDIVICPFFRIKKYINTSFEYQELTCSCSLDTFISRNFPIKNEEPSQKEMEIIKRKTMELCSLECPKVWDMYDTNTESYYPEYDSSFTGFSQYPPF